MNPQDYLELAQLYAAYAHAVDSGDWERWPAFFTDTCSYRLQPRENHARGLPLATLSFESKGMLEDRVYGIKETLFHDPYYQRHVVGLPQVHRVDDSGAIHSEANYAVFRTGSTGPPLCSTSAAISMSWCARQAASSSPNACASTTAK